MPDTVLITTTINVPTVLRLYRRYAPDDTMFIIAGDLKSPHEAIMELLDDIQPAIYLPPDYQRRYECSEHMGWNCIQRRNIALLEAMKLHPKAIITVDDDNLPLSERYFEAMMGRLYTPYSGMVATGCDWFNVGGLFEPPFCHRGFPELAYSTYSRYKFDLMPTTDCRVGVWEGLWLGDPDVSAWFRSAYSTSSYGLRIMHLPDLFEHGMIVDKDVFAPFNTQNTAIASEIVPLMGQLPGVGRYDDIWSSYIAQRIMWEHNYHIGYGSPICWQERNEHSLERDQEAEAFGEAHTEHFCAFLRGLVLPDMDIVGQLAFLYQKLALLEYMPEQTLEFGQAWIRDLEKVL